MIRYKNECCNCATEGYPCWGDACPRRRVPHYYCDKCGTEIDPDDVNEEELCEECMIVND